MPRQDLTVADIMAILPETPRRIAAVTAGLSPDQLGAAPEPGAWSVIDVLAHLRASHDVLGGNILRIMAEDHPAWRRLSPRAWMKKTDYATWTFESAFAAFQDKREGLLDVLGPMPADAWQRTATVNEFGSNVERTALFFGDWLAGHELVHITQIEEIASVVAA